MGPVGSMTQAAGRRRGVIAAITWLVSLCLLLVVSAVTTIDPAATTDLPQTGSLPWWVAVAVLTAQSLILWRSPWTPVATMLVVATATLPLAVTTGSTYGVATPAVVVTVYMALLSTDFTSSRYWLLGAGLVLAIGYAVANTGLGLTSAPLALLAAAQSAVLITVPTVAASLVRSQREVRSAVRREQEALAREHDAQVAAAVAGERTAMARELHDIAAHHMSGIALMATGVERQIDATPDRAKDGARAIRDQSRIVLEDLRRLVGLLREEGSAETDVHSLSAIEDLIAAAPVAIRLDLNRGTGDLGQGIGPLGQLVGYRMVQESLANAARHAPGAPLVVTIDDRDDAQVLLRVHNSPALSPSTDSADGFGLAGMRERAELISAALRYGPTPEGGWEVQLCIPRDPDRVGPEGIHS